MSPNQRFLVFVIVVVSIGGYVLCRRADNGGLKAGASDSSQPVEAKIADPKLRDLIKSLTASFESLEAFSAETTLKLAEAGGMPGETLGKGLYKLLRADGKTKLRFDARNNITIDNLEAGEGNKYWTYEYITQIYDGEHLYLQIRQTGFDRARKVDYDPNAILQLGGTELFSHLSQEDTLTLLPDDVIDERPTYAIRTTPTAGGLVGTHWFDKQTGIRLRIIETEGDGSEYFRLDVHNIDLKPSFEEGTFQYILPEKLQLIDETQSSPKKP